MVAVSGVTELADIPIVRIVNRFMHRVYDDDGIWFCESWSLPWCISYGHHEWCFLTFSEAIQFAAEQQFIAADMIGAVESMCKTFVEGVIIDDRFGS